MKLSIITAVKNMTVLRSGVAAICLAVSVGAMAANSSFGQYTEKPQYSQYTRSSQYIAVADGTKLAVDIFRPATNGKIETKPLPVIFYYGRYWRAKQLPNGTIMTNLGPWQPGQKIASLQSRDDSGRLIYWDTGRESVASLMSHGYIFVRAESRGTGASEGISEGDHALIEASDGADLIQWLSSQSWSSGKVGMIGGSYPGMTQLKIAALAPPALKAIFPAVPSFDFYQLATGGSGLLHKGILSFGQGQAKKDGLLASDESSNNIPQAVPVDSDKTGKLLKQILSYRKKNSPPNAVVASLQDAAPELIATLMKLTKRLGLKSPMQALGLMASPAHLQKALLGKPELQKEIAAGLHVYRDTPAFSQARAKGTVTPSAVLDGIQKSAIPMYIWTGWYDQDTIGAFQLFHNFKGPKKITAGVWSHGPNEDNGRQDNPRDDYEAQARELLRGESLRWFDYWLKGIKNGVMSEDSVHYAYANKNRNLIWKGEKTWPVSKSEPHSYFLSPASGSGDPVDDGILLTKEPKASKLTFTVDYTKTMGPQSRYHDSMSGVAAMIYPDMVAHAEGEGALVFTTPPLSKDKLLVGHPVVKIYARSTAADGEVFAYLEEVDSNGNVTYLTEGLLRASHHKISDISYASFGIPMSSSTRASVNSAAGFDEGVTELRFSLQPTANLFEKGHKIRLVITGADMHNYLAPVFVPSPELTIYSGGKRASTITLPLISTE